VNDEKRVTARRTFVHAGECDFSVLGAVVHDFEHLLWGANRNFGTVLNENTFDFVFFDFEPGFGSWIKKDIRSRRSNIFSL
jgi:hypothetical protein